MRAMVRNSLPVILNGKTLQKTATWRAGKRVGHMTFSSGCVLRREEW